MKMKLWLQCTLAAALALVAFYFAFGFYLEDNEPIVASVVYGVLGRLGAEQWWSDFQVFLLPALYYLAKPFPHVPVYGIWKVLFALLVYSSLLYYAVVQLKRYGAVSGVALATIAVVVWIITSDSVLYQHCVRHSVLLGMAALLLQGQHIEQYGKSSKAALLIFFVSVIARMHAAALLLAAFLLFHLLSGMRLTKIIRHYWVMGLLAGAFIVAYQLYGVYTTNMGKYIEAHYEYALIEKASLYPLSNMHSLRDTAKYEAITQFFFSDSAEFTIPFFDRVVNIKYENASFFSKENLTLAASELKLEAQRVLPALSLTGVVILLLVVGNHKLKNVHKSVALITACVLLLVALLLVLVNEIKPRFFSPFTGVLVFAVFMFNYPAFLHSSKMFSRWLVLGLVLIVAVFQVNKIYTASVEEKQKEAQRRIAMVQLHNLTNAHPVFIFMGADIPFAAALFYRTPTDTYRQMVSFDGGYLVYFSYLRDRFSDLFGTSLFNYPALINLLATRPDIRFYALPERLEIVNQYFTRVYGVELATAPEQPQPQLGLNGTVYKVRIVPFKNSLRP